MNLLDALEAEQCDKFRLPNGRIGYLRDIDSKHLWVFGENGNLVQTDIEFDHVITELVINVPNKGEFKATVEYGHQFNCDDDLSYVDPNDDYEYSHDFIVEMILYALDSDEPTTSGSWDCGLSFTATHTPACIEIEE